MNKKRTITLFSILLSVALGNLCWSAANSDPRWVALGHGALDNFLFGESSESQQFITLQESRPAHYGFINSTGMCVIPAAYDKASSFSEGLCAVRVNEKWGFINKRGEMIVKPRFSSVKDFSEGLAAVKEGTVWGYIDRVGNYLVVPSRWSDAKSFKHGVAIVVDGFKCGIIYRSGEYVCRDLDSIEPLSAGFYRLKKGDLYGFIRQDGRDFVAPKYDDASDFSEGLAAVCQGKQWGYIDSTFKMVITPQFASAGDFHNGLAVASQAGKYGIIDKAGTFRLKPIYKYLSAIPPIDTNAARANCGTASSGVGGSDGAVSAGHYEPKNKTVGSSAGIGVSTILVDGVAYSSSSADPASGDAERAKGKKSASLAKVGFKPVALSDGTNLTPIIVEKSWGYADINGAMAIPAQYADVRLFSEGLAAVAMYDSPLAQSQAHAAVDTKAKDEAGLVIEKVEE